MDHDDWDAILVYSLWFYLTFVLITEIIHRHKGW